MFMMNEILVSVCGMSGPCIRLILVTIRWLWHWARTLLIWRTSIWGPPHSCGIPKSYFSGMFYCDLLSRYVEHRLLNRSSVNTTIKCSLSLHVGTWVFFLNNLGHDVAYSSFWRHIGGRKKSFVSEQKRPLGYSRYNHWHHCTDILYKTKKGPVSPILFMYRSKGT